MLGRGFVVFGVVKLLDGVDVDCCVEGVGVEGDVLVDVGEE